jgi:hypothetical protein
MQGDMRMSWAVSQGGWGASNGGTAGGVGSGYLVGVHGRALRTKCCQERWESWEAHGALATGGRTQAPSTTTGSALCS